MSQNPIILVIDDDTRLRNLLAKFLQDNGFEISIAKDTNEARLILNSKTFDLLIVDVMMPNENGIEFTQNFRKNSSTPIIMLTARGEIDDRIKGLEVGADDYIQKPFEPKEILLRINNVLKRSGRLVNKSFDTIHDVSFGEFIFNIINLRLRKSNDFIHLTDSEAKILKVLCENIGKSISRQKLSDLFGGIDDRSIDVTITRLRRKIEKNPKQPHYLQTVRNHGYILHK
ncbi:MAG: response regulator [Proteobacteria bacterium]|nr:response regulator [Pseudomonadota bacterium]NCA27978.1 response regulator [Pseudomonadota bacterium]